MKKTTTIIAVVLMLVLGGFVLTGCARTAATVNGEKISYAELDKELETLYGKVVLEALVMKKLIAQDAKKNKVVVSDEEVNKKLDELKSNPYFEQMLKMQNTTLASLKNEIRLQISLKKLLVKGVTDSQLKAFFEENKDRLQKIKASHILVKTPEEAKKCEEMLAKGSDFAALAKEVSTDPGSKEKGGALGYFSKADVDPTFFKAAFETPAGKISAAVKTPYGYHIIKVEDKKETYDQLKDDVVQAYADNTKLKDYIDGLRKNAKIKIYLPGVEQKEEKQK